MCVRCVCISIRDDCALFRLRACSNQSMLPMIDVCMCVCSCKCMYVYVRVRMFESISASTLMQVPPEV